MNYVHTQLCSVVPWKLLGVKYYIVHTCMYSMPYYTYGSTDNLLRAFSAYIYILYQKNGAVMRIYVVLEN